MLTGQVTLTNSCSPRTVCFQEDVAHTKRAILFCVVIFCAIVYTVRTSALMHYVIPGSKYSGHKLQNVPSSMTDYCNWKNNLRHHNKTLSYGLERALFRPRRVYIGASGKQFAGWESYNVNRLNVTDKHDFAKLFCLGDIEAFHSEHTFEHIDRALMKPAFELFYDYLEVGGYVRTAIPAYAPDHIASDLDKQYGHINFITADELVALMKDTGFKGIKKLEWTDFQTSQVHTTSWDFCEGPVIRSVQHDPRNQDFLRRNCHRLNLTYSEDGKTTCSRLDENTFLMTDIKVRSTIVQGFKL